MDRRQQYKVQLELATRMKVPLDLFSASSRNPQAVLARWMAWYILSGKFGLSHEFIGKLYGKNRTTVMHGLKEVKKIDIKEKLDDIIRDPRFA